MAWLSGVAVQIIWAEDIAIEEGTDLLGALKQ